MAKTYTAVDPARLGRVVIVSGYIQLVSEALLILAYAYAMSGPGQAIVDVNLRASDLPVALAGIAYLLAYLVGGFLALKWIYRVNRNAHAFAQGLTISPPWAVGWFFVPVAMLWKPYEAISEAWQASERPKGWRTAPKPRFLGWWWAAWLISNVLGSIANIVAKATPDVVANSIIMITGLLAAMIAGVLFIRVVGRLSSLQQTQIDFGIFGENVELGPPPRRGGVVDPQRA